MGQRRVGFEGELYWGTAGSTAATQLTIARDVHYVFTQTYADVTDRASAIEYSEAVTTKPSLDFEINNDATNAFVAAVRSAAIGRTLIAFRTKDRSGGVGLDGDFFVDLDETQPLKDGQRIKVTCTPSQRNRDLTWA